MRIAQVAPLYESVPPKFYGGTERVVHYVTEALVELGHDVTLFASGDSLSNAKIVPGCRTALRLTRGITDPAAYHFLQIERVYQHAAEFDVIHSHLDYYPLSLARRSRTPTVTTLHGRLDIPDIHPTFREYRELPFVSISQAQREPMPWMRWAATVPHGLPRHLLAFSERATGGYLAFLGRISPEKRVDRAIAIARRVGIPLRIAAKVDAIDREYFEQRIAPLLREPEIDYIGEIGERDKSAFLGGATALLFPIDWPEPFGLVMIEAMACGTPVVAYRGGSVTEVIDEGVTGYVVETLDQAVKAVEHASALDRRAVRERFLSRFTAGTMAQAYVRVYEALAE